MIESVVEALLNFSGVLYSSAPGYLLGSFLFYVSIYLLHLLFCS
uniref:Macaca fascicularis brain cDNA clone: QflA-16191, similar to human hypothetical protein FLJ23754 (FLJ23754), mRNA, RefSeq: NM_152675.1 n=1 Tax=Macaca fascicularis TaxID=9541 RepID=I7GLT6_MACFA|nr:unnamed protein product [Macaca fascicularis]